MPIALYFHFEFMENLQTKWEFLKYKIRKFTINYSKTIAKKRKKQRINLELKLKNLENNLINVYVIT